jgi:hypothetical protein
MTEINGFVNLAQNIETAVNNAVQAKPVDIPVVPTEETELNPNDGKEISVKETPNHTNPNLSFIENKPVTAVFAMGFSIHSAGETKQILNIGFSLATKLGNEAVSGNRISIQGEPVTSILMNVAVLTSRMPVHNCNHESRKEALKVPVQTFEKMMDENSVVESYTEPEKTFFEAVGIKVEKNEEGKVDYIYSESPTSPPKKLSKQEVIDIYSHIINILNDESLFNSIIEMGKKMDEQIAQSKKAANAEQEESEKKEASQPTIESKIIKYVDDKANPNKAIDEKEDFRKIKTGNSDDGFINATAEQEKAKAKYHFQKLDEINQERFQINHQKAEKITTETVSKIEKETKEITPTIVGP